MKRTGIAAVLAVVVLAGASHVNAQATGQGRAVITVFSKHSELAPNVVQQDVSVKINGKDAEVTGWAPFKGADEDVYKRQVLV